MCNCFAYGAIFRRFIFVENSTFFLRLIQLEPKHFWQELHLFYFLIWKRQEFKNFRNLQRKQNFADNKQIFTLKNPRWFQTAIFCLWETVLKYSAIERFIKSLKLPNFQVFAMQWKKYIQTREAYQKTNSIMFFGKRRIPYIFSKPQDYDVRQKKSSFFTYMLSIKISGFSA